MTHSAASPLPSQVKKPQSRSERSARKLRASKAAQCAVQAENAQQTQDADAKNVKQNNAFADKKNIMWVLLSGAMALTFVVMLFLPDTGMGKRCWTSDSIYFTDNLAHSVYTIALCNSPSKKPLSD